MELPANPNRLSLTGYDEFGYPLDQNDDQSPNTPWQFEDDDENTKEEYDQTPMFGDIGGIY